jgi:TPR repeat protein
MLIKYSLRIKDFFKEYNGISLDSIKSMADKGDIEADIYLDYLKGLNGMKPGKDLSDEAIQAFTRSSERGCPVSQYNLARGLLKRKPETAISLLRSSAKSGLIEAHSELGRADSLI